MRRPYSNPQSRTAYQNKAIFVRMPMVTQNTLSITGETDKFLAIHLNDAFDPEAAIGGQQPLGYDQFKALWQQYEVIGCKWKVEFRRTGQNNLFAAGFCHAWVDDDATSQYNDLSWLQVQTLPKIHRKIMSIPGGRNDVTIMKGFATARKVLPRGIDPAEYVANIAASPTQKVVLHVGISSFSTAVATETVSFIIRTVFYVRFFDPLEFLTTS